MKQRVPRALRIPLRGYQVSATTDFAPTAPKRLNRQERRAENALARRRAKHGSPDIIVYDESHLLSDKKTSK